MKFIIFLLIKVVVSCNLISQSKKWDFVVSLRQKAKAY